MTDAHSATEPVPTTDADTLCINTIRTLAMDAVQARTPDIRYADGVGTRGLPGVAAVPTLRPG